MTFIKGYDPETLREIIDAAQCRERLAEIEMQRSVPALLERVWLLKVLGQLDEGIDLADEAVRVARMAGTRKDLLRARVLRATVRQFRGEHEAALKELDQCVAEAEGIPSPLLAAFAYQHRGKTHYDVGDYLSARDDFKSALLLRQDTTAPEEQIEATLLAIEAADRRRAAESRSLVSGVGGGL